MKPKAYYNEIDPFAANWLRELIKAGHIAYGDVDERSIEDVVPSDLMGYTQCHFFAGIGVWSYALRQSGWPDDRQVWTGSCPCQPFSTAGKGAGFDDERHLWPAWFHLIRVCKPANVFGEQVASKDGLAWLDLVQSDLEGENYRCGATDLCAAGIGAPHIRQRLWIVADATVGYCDSTRFSSRQFQRKPINSRPECSHQSGLSSELANPESTELNRNRAKQSGASSGSPNGSILGNSDNSEGARIREHSWQILPIEEAEGLRVRRLVGGVWGDADWIWCRDQKYRPVEPGTFPLAHGSPNRVGRLRGFGNAINAEAAKEVITAYMSLENGRKGKK